MSSSSLTYLIIRNKSLDQGSLSLNEEVQN
jgi:hypothetical protein